uniref:Uncharacterized protein n=3 Tax=Dunaliella tertiolecta TaxID=3047 RepID=A0A7S3QUD5_DUNTE
MLLLTALPASFPPSSPPSSTLLSPSSQEHGSRAGLACASDSCCKPHRPCIQGLTFSGLDLPELPLYLSTLLQLPSRPDLLWHPAVLILKRDVEPNTSMVLEAQCGGVWTWHHTAAQSSAHFDTNAFMNCGVKTLVRTPPPPLPASSSSSSSHIAAAATATWHMSVRGPDPLGVRRCSHLNSFSLQHTPLSCPLDCTEPTLLDQLLRQLYAFEGRPVPHITLLAQQVGDHEMRLSANILVTQKSLKAYKRELLQIGERLTSCELK